MNISEFDENDWAHLHDVVYGIYHRDSTRDELEKIFESLPRELKFIAYEHGMNDTVFRDDTHMHLRNKKNLEIEHKDNLNHAFTVWVIKMLNEGRISFHTRPGVWGEPDIDELDIIVEFPAGGEVIGNDGSGTFSWRDLQKMAEKQGLLNYGKR